LIPNYKELINTLLKYTVDENNKEIRQMFLILLINLAKKTKLNFRIEFENAEKMK